LYTVADGVFLYLTCEQCNKCLEPCDVVWWSAALPWTCNSTCPVISPSNLQRLHKHFSPAESLYSLSGDGHWCKSDSCAKHKYDEQ